MFVAECSVLPPLLVCLFTRALKRIKLSAKNRCIFRLERFCPEDGVEDKSTAVLTIETGDRELHGPVVVCVSVSAEARIRFQDRPSGVCSGQGDTGGKFWSRHFGLSSSLSFHQCSRLIKSSITIAVFSQQWTVSLNRTLNKTRTLNIIWA